MLHRILNLAKNLLNSVDNRQKIVARTIYAQVKAWGEESSPSHSFPVAEEHLTEMLNNLPQKVERIELSVDCFPPTSEPS